MINEEKLKIEIIVSQYLKSVYSFICRLTNDSEIAKDISQEVFIKVWKNLGKYNSKQNFKTWLFTIARNTTIDWLRKKKSITFSELDGGDNNSDDSDIDFSSRVVDPELLPEELFERRELKKQLEEVLVQISFDERFIILLHLEEDLTFGEIAAIIDRPINTVKSRYRRALLRLRQIMQVAPK